MADSPRRGRGRPPLDPDDASVQFNVTIPSRQFDALCEVAHRHRASVPEVVRRMVKTLITAKSADTTPEK